MNSIIILLIIGVVSGILSGMVGVGGGIVIVPALVFFLGYTQQGAQGTSLAVLLLPVGIMAVINYYKQGTININHALLISAGFVIGGYFGSKLAITLFKAEGTKDIVKTMFGFLLLFVAFKFLNVWGWISGFFQK
jgi:uncharacterized membrane protein YfcA